MAKDKEPAAETSPAPAKAAGVIRHPFAGLKAGVKYAYTRVNWPAPQSGTKTPATEFTAEVKELTFQNRKGALETEQLVQLNGKGKLYSFKELPEDATFTEI